MRIKKIYFNVFVKDKYKVTSKKNSSYMRKLFFILRNIIYKLLLKFNWSMESSNSL